ncbi:YrhB domain-containing protein [Streptomyces fulvoviolaceus]|uniref:YrhB domain-containing protein n=1 Tax=Streptomyces fulvoviolaceus TaxID=285535 RepID=UPI0028F74697|nr:YrhB domain-containing protein [Streptomyces fulvoviolaceus]
MIERADAVRIVEEHLEPGLVVVQAREHELVWIVDWQSEEFVRTRNPGSMLIGNGPYLVDRVDGGLHQVGVVSAVTGAWEDDYRARIRAQVVRTAVDDLHDELRDIAAARGRIHAMHALRATVPALSHGQVIEYVTALQNGDAPAHLVALASRELAPPSTRYSP